MNFWQFSGSVGLDFGFVRVNETDDFGSLQGAWCHAALQVVGSRLCSGNPVFWYGRCRQSK